LKFIIVVVDDNGRCLKLIFVIVFGNSSFFVVVDNGGIGTQLVERSQP
jgi:hypothetical protein